MATMAGQSQRPPQKPSFRSKFKASLKPSALRAYLDQPSHKGSKSDNVEARTGVTEASAWAGGRTKRKSRAEKEEAVLVLGQLNIDVGDFEDLKLSFDGGNDMYSLRDTVQQDVSFKPGKVQHQRGLSAKLDQNQRLNVVKQAPLQSSTGKSTADAGQENVAPVSALAAIDGTRKCPKHHVKTDNLARPVSRSTARSHVTRTIADVTRPSYKPDGNWGSPVDTTFSVRPSIDSNQSKISAPVQTEKVDSVLGSSTSVSTYGVPRRPLGDAQRASNLANRHSVGDMDKLTSSGGMTDLETKRQSFPPVAVRRQSLINMHSASQRPRSPTGSVTSTASVSRPRRPSGSLTTQRLAWIKDLEAKGGAKTPGQEYMHRKLEGGVAEKLRRFESQNSQATPAAVLKRASTGDAYGIEVNGKRISRTFAADDDFRKKLNEQFQKKQKEDEERALKAKKATSSLQGKTPQQIIDFAELSDRDREAHINDMMRGGRGTETARALDVQARNTLSAVKSKMFEHYPTSSSSKTPLTVFHNATTALKSNARLVDVKAPRGLSRTMSVQQSRKPVQASVPRPASYVAFSSTASIDDDYDPFNYMAYVPAPNPSSQEEEGPGLAPFVEKPEKSQSLDTNERIADTASLNTTTSDLVDECGEKAEMDTTVKSESFAGPGSAERQLYTSPNVPDMTLDKVVVSEAPLVASAQAPQSSAAASSGWAARFSSKAQTPAAVPGPIADASYVLTAMTEPCASTSEGNTFIAAALPHFRGA